MANPSDITWGLDVYRIVAYPLSSTGALLATDTAPYEGVFFSGPKSFIPSLGSVRNVVNVSQGRVNDTIHLPSIDPKTAELRCSYDKQTLDALLSNTNKSTLAEGTTTHFGTNKEGTEQLVGLLVSQLISHDDDGLLVWRHYIVPRATIVPSPVNFDENAIDKLYQVTMSGATRELWGEVLTEATHGCTSSTLTQHVTQNNFAIVAWLADGTEPTFYFPSDKPPVSAAKTKLWNFATGANVAFALADDAYGEGVTPSVLPANATLLIATYEWE
jgi:hypothetical protein